MAQELNDVNEKKMKEISSLLESFYPDKGIDVMPANFQRVTLPHFLAKLEIDEITEALHIAFSKCGENPDNMLKYFCGICWNIIREKRERPTIRPTPVEYKRKQLEPTTKPIEDRKAETVLLGSMIIDPACILFIVEHLPRVEAFYWIQHRIIYEVIAMLHHRNREIDAISIRDVLEKDGTLDEIGGVDYLAKLLESVPSSANVESYVNLVRDKWIERELRSGVSLVASKSTVREAFEKIEPR